MRLRTLLVILCSAAMGVALAEAQSSVTGGTARNRPANSKAATAKGPLPDADLLDGSSYEAEKRPEYGMIGEFEMEGSEQKSDRVGGNPGPAGAQSAAQQEQGGGAGGVPPPPGAEQQVAGTEAQQIASGTDDRKDPDASQQGGASSAAGTAGGPAAAAQGIQVANLQIPQGAQGAQGAPDGKPSVQKLGDASLQIQTSAAKAEDVVGKEASTAQQYEKKVPPGGYTNNRNVGAEKGQVMPKGI